MNCGQQVRVVEVHTVEGRLVEKRHADIIGCPNDQPKARMDTWMLEHSVDDCQDFHNHGRSYSRWVITDRRQNHDVCWEGGETLEQIRYQMPRMDEWRSDSEE